jgi:hypothetical protein
MHKETLVEFQNFWEREYIKREKDWRGVGSIVG